MLRNWEKLPHHTPVSYSTPSNRCPGQYDSVLCNTTVFHRCLTDSCNNSYPILHPGTVEEWRHNRACPSRYTCLRLLYWTLTPCSTSLCRSQTHSYLPTKSRHRNCSFGSDEAKNILFKMNHLLSFMLQKWYQNW